MKAAPHRAVAVSPPSRHRERSEAISMREVVREFNIPTQ